MTTLPSFPLLATLAVAIGVLVHVALTDLRIAKIRNTSILILLAVWAVLMALEGFGRILDSLAAGGLMLAIGVAAWLMRVMGAGDSKLLLVAGLMLGIETLVPFSMLLALSTAVFVVVLALVKRFAVTLPPAAYVRVADIVATRKIPAAVPISTALVLCLPIRYGLYPL